MKKSVIVLIGSLIFLMSSIFFVFRSNQIKDYESMTPEYVETNFEIDMFEEKVDNKIILNVDAQYIGNHKITEEPEIKLQIDCVYMYEEIEQKYTDMKTAELILKKKDNKYIGNLELDLNREILDMYSCSYQIIDTTGSYEKK